MTTRLTLPHARSISSCVFLPIYTSGGHPPPPRLSFPVHSFDLPNRSPPPLPLQILCPHFTTHMYTSYFFSPAPTPVLPPSPLRSFFQCPFVRIHWRHRRSMWWARRITSFLVYPGQDPALGISFFSYYDPTWLGSYYISCVRLLCCWPVLSSAMQPCVLFGPLDSMAARSRIEESSHSVIP